MAHRDDTFETEVDLATTVEETWELITDPDALGEWLGGVVDVDPAEGAEGTIWFPPQPGTSTSTDEPNPAFVAVERVVPGERLTFRWATSSRPPTQVDFVVEPVADRSRLVITERRVPEGRAVPTIRMQAALAGVR